MVIYTCIKCNKIFGQKCHYLNHLNKKFDCNPNIKSPDITPVIQQNPPNFNNLEENNINSNICNYCNAIFTRKDHLKRHIEERCKVKKLKEDDEEKDKENIFKLLLAKEEEIKKINEENKKKDEENKKNNKEL